MLENETWIAHSKKTWQTTLEFKVLKEHTTLMQNWEITKIARNEARITHSTKKQLTILNSTFLKNRQERKKSKMFKNAWN